MPRIHGAQDVPFLVKHVTMAVFNKRVATNRSPPWTPVGLGSEQESFLRAYAIAVSVLKKQKNLTMSSSATPNGFVILTSSGVSKESRHASDNAAATSEFNRLYNSIYPIKDKGANPISDQQARVVQANARADKEAAQITEDAMTTPRPKKQAGIQKTIDKARESAQLLAHRTNRGIAKAKVPRVRVRRPPPGRI